MKSCVTQFVLILEILPSIETISECVVVLNPFDSVGFRQIRSDVDHLFVPCATYAMVSHKESQAEKQNVVFVPIDTGIL